MDIVKRSRKIRPSTRLEKSKSYKVDTKKIVSGQILEVTVSHESEAFEKVYRFSGKEIAEKNSINFSVSEANNKVEVSWSVDPD